MIDLLEKTTSVFGPSGNEEKIKTFIEQQIQDKVNDIYTDNLGNLIAVKNGSPQGKKIMLAAHMDQIGFMITHIDENGFLRFTTIGGINEKFLPGKSVTFLDGTRGTIGHEKIDNITDLEMEKMYIDIGEKNEEKAKEKINIGDPAIFSPTFSKNENRVISSYLDDRIGCYILIQLIKQLSDSPHHIYFVFTVQEELGARGAKTAAYNISPDLGIAVDVTGTGDTPEARTMDVSLGDGAAIKIKDSSTITHPQVKQLLIDTAKEYEINYQLEVLEYGGTDAGNIHLTKGGIPSGAVSIPSRYIHTPTEMIDMDDVEASIDLLQKVVENNIDL